MESVIESIVEAMQGAAPTLCRRSGYRLAATYELSAILRKCCHKHRAVFIEERRLKLFRVGVDNKRKRYGHLDFSVRGASGITYAIEIDSSNKAWSLQKLIYCRRELGWRALWVRWAGQVDAGVPQDVCVFDLTGNTLRQIHPEALHMETPDR